MNRTAYIILAWLFCLLSFFGFAVGDFKFLVLCGIFAVVISNFSRK